MTQVINAPVRPYFPGERHITLFSFSGFFFGGSRLRCACATNANIHFVAGTQTQKSLGLRPRVRRNM